MPSKYMLDNDINSSSLATDILKFLESVIFVSSYSDNV